MDKTSSIFNNPQPKKVIKAANKSKAKYLKNMAMTVTLIIKSPLKAFQL